MIDQIFFSLEDVQSVRNTSSNIEYFDRVAQEVQRKFVQRLLGDELYIALLDDLNSEGIPVAQRFVNLLNGERYSHRGKPKIFRGVKMYCAYVWTYLAPLDSEVNITPIGAQIFKDEEAVTAKGKQAYEQMKQECIETANDMESAIKDYLDENSYLFAEWDDGSSIEVAERTSVNTRVFGKTFKSANQKFL